MRGRRPWRLTSNGILFLGNRNLAKWVIFNTDMIQKIIKIVLIVIGVAVVAVLAVKGLSQEDDWICVDGQWVKHGVPSAPMPTEPCDKAGEEIMTVKV